MKTGKIIALVFALVSLCACATIEKPEIREVQGKPVISPTLLGEDSADKKSGLKRKVAIARFSNETSYGQSFFLDKQNDRVGKQAVDILSGKLLQTEKFILLERADIDKVNNELALGNYDPLKNMVDYLIVGSVSEFGRKTQGKVGIFSRTKRQIATAKVHVRLIDVKTGQILYSEEGEGEAFTESGRIFGVGERAGYDSSINDRALEAAISNLASNIIENLLNKPWRSYILGYEDEKLIIAGGASQNIRKNETFTVMAEGKKVKNPQTNMTITLPGKKLGTIRVVLTAGDTPETEVTFCDITEGDLQRYILSKDFSSLYIQEK